jgi:superfamily II DNA/RNA helicase
MKKIIDIKNLSKIRDNISKISSRNIFSNMNKYFSFCQNNILNKNSNIFNQSAKRFSSNSNNDNSTDFQNSENLVQENNTNNIDTVVENEPIKKKLTKILGVNSREDGVQPSRSNNQSYNNNNNYVRNNSNNYRNNNNYDNNRNDRNTRYPDRLVDTKQYEKIPKPFTEWGNRHNRAWKVNPAKYMATESLIMKHIQKMNDTSEEDKQLMYSSSNLDGLGIYFNNNPISPESIPNHLENNDVSLLDSIIEESLVKSLLRLRMEKLSPIQQRCFPILLDGNDIIGCAQTGSGKTMAFLLPIINNMIKNGPPAEDINDNNNNKVEERNVRKIQNLFENYSKNFNIQDHREVGRSDNQQIDSSYVDPNASKPVAMVIAPTRELAQQIFDECLKLTQNTGITAACIYGGEPMYVQQNELRSKVDIIIATPGRLTDFCNQGKISLKEVKYLVLDEADRMLDMGFQPQIEKLDKSFDMRPKSERQNIMFSATFDKKITNVANQFLNNQNYFFIGNPDNKYTINKEIAQRIIFSKSHSKNKNLQEIMEAFADEKIIIFSETKSQCDYIEDTLNSYGYRARAIHGDKDQSVRTSCVKGFNKGDFKVLVATSVAARGMDFDNIGLVINYDCPNTIDDYVHKIGRTGRKGKLGKAITFVDQKSDAFVLKGIVEILKSTDQIIPDEIHDYINLGYKSTQKGGGQKRNNDFSGNRDGNRGGNKGGNYSY